MPRGRPPGSKNVKRKPQDETPNGATEAAADSAGPGHNSSASLTEDQLQKRFFGHVREYKAELELKKGCDEAKRAADAAFKNLCKRIKGEGTPIEDIKTHLELQSPEGEATMRQKMEAQLRIARWNGLPLGSQTDLFAGVDRTPAVDKARTEGKIAGLKGDDAKPPYAAESPQGQSWMEGWHDGQAVNLDGIKATPGAGPAPDSDEQFDDSTAENPSRRRQGDPLEGAEGEGSYRFQ